MNNEETPDSRGEPPAHAGAGFARSFPTENMSIGVITPLEGFEGPIPTMDNHIELIQKAENVGVATVWVRDVPLLVPSFGDTGQMFDVWTYLGYLAAKTQKIALGTASAVLPLRHPIMTAKSATSIDQLSNGRFLLGVAAGDRPVEFPAFGIDYSERSDRFLESLRLVRQFTEEDFPKVTSSLGHVEGADLVPKPTATRLPIMMTGRAGQTVEWVADNADGWLFYTLPLQQQALNIKRWRRLTSRDEGVFKPFAQATYIDLAENPKEAPRPIHQGLRLGREPLRSLLKTWQEIGVDQLMINFKHSQRAVDEVLDELGEYILPHFPAGN